MRVQDEMILQVLKSKRLEGRKNSVWNQRLCLVYLAMRSTTSSKEITVRVSDMALSLDMPGRTVRGTLERLEAAGLIEKCAYQYGPYRRYTLHL